MKQVHILLVDDQTIVRRGVRALLQDRKDCEVCGEARTSDEALLMVESLKPDLVILGLLRQNLGGVVRQIRGVLPSVEVLVLSTRDEEAFVRRAVAAGALGTFCPPIQMSSCSGP